MTILSFRAKSVSCFALVALIAVNAFGQQNNRVPSNTTVARSQPRAVVPAQGGDRIAVIDVNYIFKNHAGFNKLVEGWKQKVQSAEGQIKNKSGQIEQQVKQLRLLKPGNPQFREMEASLAKQRADLQVEVQLNKKELMLEEAKMYLTVYEQVKNEVSYFARQNGITLVLRYNSGEIDKEDPRQIQSLMLRPVLYQSRIDITKQVLDRLNGTAATLGNRPPARGAAPSQSRR